MLITWMCHSLVLLHLIASERIHNSQWNTRYMKRSKLGFAMQHKKINVVCYHELCIRECIFLHVSFHHFHAWPALKKWQIWRVVAFGELTKENICKTTDTCKSVYMNMILNWYDVLSNRKNLRCWKKLEKR